MFLKTCCVPDPIPFSSGSWSCDLAAVESRVINMTLSSVQRVIPDVSVSGVSIVKALVDHNYGTMVNFKREKKIKSSI